MSVNGDAGYDGTGPDRGCARHDTPSPGPEWAPHRHHGAPPPVRFKPKGPICRPFCVRKGGGANPRPSGYEIARTASPQARSRMTAWLRWFQISPAPLNIGTMNGTTARRKICPQTRASGGSSSRSRARKRQRAVMTVTATGTTMTTAMTTGWAGRTTNAMTEDPAASPCQHRAAQSAWGCYAGRASARPLSVRRRAARRRSSPAAIIARVVSARGGSVRSGAPPKGDRLPRRPARLARHERGLPDARRRSSAGADRGPGRRSARGLAGRDRCRGPALRSLA
jgi:hypothetical protein